MQAQSNLSQECHATEAVLIESLLEQAQDTLFQSNQISHTGEKTVMLNTAKKFAEDVLALDNKNSDAHHILALSHTLLGESSRAKRHIAKAFELAEPSHTLQIEKAHIDLAAGHYNKAETGFLDVLKSEPGNVDAFLGMAITRQKKKDWGSAFLHYNSLINKGYINDTVISGLYAVVPYIDVEFWSAEYEATILTALTHSEADKSLFSQVSNSLLIHKYGLEKEDSRLDFAELIDDSLLLTVLQHKLIITPEVEQLVVLIRETLLTQVCDARELPTLLQEWVICIAETAAFYGYSWPVSDQETLILAELSQAIKAGARGPNCIENCTGAVMLYAMYEELYSSPFSYLIMGIELEEWPAGLQSVMASSLYEPSELHATEIELKQVISPSHSSLIYERAPLPPFPKWTNINTTDEQSATQYLLDTFGPGVPLKASRKRPLNILVSASGTGRHVLQQAAQFNDVNLTGADTSIANLAFAEYQARNLDIDNIRWVQCAENKLTCLNQSFDIVDWSTPLNYSDDPTETIKYVRKLMARKGIAKLRVELNQVRDTENLLKQLALNNHLEPNLNTLRSVRRAIIEDTNKQDWQAILDDPAFYHAGSCTNILFGKSYSSISGQQLNTLLEETGMQVIGIADNLSGQVHQITSIESWEASFPLSKEAAKDVIVFVKLG